jgi:hypothetical protein
MNPSFFNRKISFGKDKTRQTFYLYIFFFFIFFLAYFLYVFFFFSASGADVYLHMVNTNRMVESNSITEFYQKSMMDEFLGYDYPFGLWYFGSIVIKITGIDIYTLVAVLPFILMVGVLLIFYCYANELLRSEDASVISLIMLISMPYISLLFLNYSAGVFTLGFLITALYLSLKKTRVANLFLVLILVITLCVSHTGTFVFFIFTALVFFIFRALIWKKFDVNFFLLLAMIIFGYNFTVQLFPVIQSHYVDKGYLIISTSSSFADVLHLDVIRQLGEIFFNTIFITNSNAYAILWIGLIFSAGIICIFIRTKAEEFYKGHVYPAGLPIIGSLTSVSHDISLAPFWLGPVHSVLSVIGFFKVDSRGKCLALTLLITSFIPGALGGAEGTGALREISYFLLIIPILAAAGFVYLIPRIASFSITPVKKWVAILVCLCVIVPLIASPIIGRLYYEPGLTMTQEEKDNLLWLGTVGSPQEGALAGAYRERMTMYGNKIVPSIPSGTDNRRASDAFMKTFFSDFAEKSTIALSSYQITYLVSSARTFKDFPDVTEHSLKIDNNTMVDKIDSSSNFFNIHKIISATPPARTTLTEPLNYESVISDTSIQDIGSSYIYENEYYKIKLFDTSPVIMYYGSKTRDQLGEGFLSDTITVNYKLQNSTTSSSATYDLGGLNYPDIIISKNEVLYKTRIGDYNNSQQLASLEVKYTFYQKTVKREITLRNDIANPNLTLDVNGRLSTSLFIPMKYFDYHIIGPDSDKWIHKIRYPAQDSVILEKDKFDSIYFDNGASGLFLSYGDSNPHPNYMSYRGSEFYDYGRVAIRSDFALSPSEPASIEQFFSIKKPAEATKDIKDCLSVSPYDYPNAIIPLILTGYSDTVNQSDYERNFLTNISGNGIDYTLAIPPSHPLRYGQSGINPSGYVSVYENKSIKNPEKLNTEIQSIKRDYHVNGVMFPKFVYDFNMTKVLRDNNMTYALALTAAPPSGEYNREGVRNPKFAYYEGERTDIVLIPVSFPTSSHLDTSYDVDTVFDQWNATINSVVDDGGMAVFQWDPDDVGDPEYLDRIMILLDYATNRGMTITTPDLVSAHYQKLQKIYVNANKTDDSVILKAYNGNGDRVQGITYQLKLPSVDDACPYTIINGTIPRYVLRDDECTVYASFDLESGENKEIVVYSPSVKKQFSTDIPVLVHGSNHFTITGENNIPVKNASVMIDTKYYESDETGNITFSVSHGNHTLRIEKAGYNPLETNIEVKARLYRVISWISSIL